MNDILDKQAARMQRAEARKARIVAYRSRNFDEAERWDLEYWQSRTPQERLAALIDIRADVEKVEQARRHYEQGA